MPTEIQHWRLRSGGAHCDLALAIEDPETKEEKGGGGGEGEGVKWDSSDTI